MNGPTDRNTVGVKIEEGVPFDGLEPRYPMPRPAGVVAHVHPSGLNMGALVAGLEPYQRAALMGMSGHALHRMIMDQMELAHGSTITLKPAPDVDVIRGHEIAMTWHDEMEGTDMLDETAPPPLVTPTDPAGPPPQALSNHVNHRDFHPSYMRVGVRIDGVERKDLKWYDVRAGLAATVDGVMLKSETIEPFWRYPENRQQRRARERWEAKHKGRGE